MKKESVIPILIGAVLAGCLVFQESRIRRLEQQPEQKSQSAADLSAALTLQAEQLSRSNVLVNVYREVTVHSSPDTFLGETGQTRAESMAGQGSGVILGQDRVLTCCHIARQADRLTVCLPGGEEQTAEILKTDPVNDLALLEVKGLGGSPARLGDSRTLQLGQPVLCVGNPASRKLAGSVSFGIVSGLDREMGSLGREGETVRVFQTDAAINGGSSGGGIYTLDGELVGIVSRKYVSAAPSDTQLEGIGMCIPIWEGMGFLDGT